jgi:hypothetical protein
MTATLKTRPKQTSARTTNPVDRRSLAADRAKAKLPDTKGMNESEAIIAGFETALKRVAKTKCHACGCVYEATQSRCPNCGDYTKLATGERPKYESGGVGEFLDAAAGPVKHSSNQADLKRPQLTDETGWPVPLVLRNCIRRA